MKVNRQIDGSPVWFSYSGVRYAKFEMQMKCVLKASFDVFALPVLDCSPFLKVHKDTKRCLSMTIELGSRKQREESGSGF